MHTQRCQMTRVPFLSIRLCLSSVRRWYSKFIYLYTVPFLHRNKPFRIRISTTIACMYVCCIHTNRMHIIQLHTTPCECVSLVIFFSFSFVVLSRKASVVVITVRFACFVHLLFGILYECAFSTFAIILHTIPNYWLY